MPVRRRDIVDLNRSGVYHCFTRCVRQDSLLDSDEAGVDRGYRRVWLYERAATLAELFPLEVIAIAILGNHFHIIVCLNPELVAAMSDLEVIRAWLRIHPLRDGRGRIIELTDERLQERLDRELEANRISWIREQLAGLSEFMRLLKEPLAKMANAEDGVGGAFFAERFKSVRILDAQALLACMVYVDLNLIRSGRCRTPEASDGTSVRERIACWRQWRSGRRSGAESGLWLMPIQRQGDRRGIEDLFGGIEIGVEEYFRLVEASGRCIRRPGQGRIPAEAAPILERIGLDSEGWTAAMGTNGWRTGSVVGAAASRAAHASRRGRRWVVSCLDLEPGSRSATTRELRGPVRWRRRRLPAQPAGSAAMRARSEAATSRFHASIDAMQSVRNGRPVDRGSSRLQEAATTGARCQPRSSATGSSSPPGPRRRTVGREPPDAPVRRPLT